ncbi:MAG: hypothetical protein KA004_10160 [Verrucomicrobiales bacterium]|nr:hypothetical protein [Verrucomicrobiales bacterium]
MKLADILSVLNFSAFRPEPDDSSASWKKRFSNKKTLLLNVGRRRVSWVRQDKRGEFSEGGSVEGEFKEVLGQMGPDWRAMADGGWCAVSLNTRSMVTLEVNLSRRAGLQEMLRTNPKAVIGAKAERGKRYSLTHNPESNTSILLACDEDAITKMESQLREAGMNIGRVTCGVHAMLLNLIEQVAEARHARSQSHPGQPFGSLLLVACCEGSVCALSQREEAWTELRSRTDCYGDDMTPVLEIILPLLQNAGPNTHVVFMSDNAESGFPGLLQYRVPGVQVSDVSVPHQLWKILTDQ